ncbi:SDR family NAD(P)-dependent oxidoreductase [Streptomyces fradiae]|uniref:SDR family NAD(P)-dependent oxidoreductase n=1 Tax=Streptomyces fradiae TaxID=1906 RepID=UPI0036D08936
MTSQDTGSAHGGPPDLPDAIAVTGLACRFPGAPDAGAFWDNLLAGRDTVTRRGRDELAALGVPADRLDDPRYVPAGGVLDGIDEFDAEYFGITPADAALMDPQQRLFLQCAVAALEDAGQRVRDAAGGVGVYASAGFNSYLTHHLLPHAAELGHRADVQWLAAGDKDYLATQTSYRLGLTGPSLSVQTACSSALVAVHLAGEALLSGECDVALAGAVSAGVGQGLGYLHTEGGILSEDGRCRPFDASATGTVFGSGVGVVVLKRLADAVADGDTVRAVLLGSAVNNDGDRKVGFTAPGLDGQVRVITAAQAVAGVGPEDVSCVEAHGTGTALGDRIELTALNRVFATAPDARRVLGAVKSNVGHLDTCAGMAGFIKTVLALRHRTLVPTAHFTRPSPDLDPARFRVLTAPEPWPGADGTRTAGVSSFGIGGTNAHVILQDPPPAARRAEGRADGGWQVLPLSARGPEALDRLTGRLAEALAAPGAPPLADAAHTLQTGRDPHPWRRAVTAAQGLPGPAAGVTPIAGPAATASHTPGTSGASAAFGAPTPSVRAGGVFAGAAFLYPGQGAGTPGMAAEPYRSEPAFRDALDRCLEALRPWTGAPLRELLLDPAHPDGLDRTEVAQPALFAVAYALTEWWAALGVRPVAVAGHSVGELAAACAAGVFTLADSARLVVRRGALMGGMPRGAMLAVPLPEAELRALIAESGPWPEDRAGADRLRHGDALQGDAGGAPEIAAVNAPDRSVAAGTPAAVARLAELLEARGVPARGLAVRHAFHTRHADGLLDDFAALVAATPARPPAVPVISSVTGRPLTAEEAGSPAYWARQLRQPVRFADALRALPDGVALLEAGPGTALTGFARRTLGADRTVLPVLGAQRGHDGPPARLTAVARLWERGADIDWTALGERAGRRKVALPTYPFARTSHWFRPAVHGAAAPAGAGAGPSGRATAGGAVPAAGQAPVGGPGRAVGSVPAVGAGPAEGATGGGGALLGVGAPAAPADTAAPVDGWLRVLDWAPALPPATAAAAPLGVLLLADEGGLADAVAEHLTGAGARVHRVRAATPGLPDGLAADGDGHLLDPDHPGAFDALAAELAARGAAPDAVVSCWAADDPDLDDASAGTVARCALRAVTVPAALCRAFGDRFADRPLRLLLVTEDALAVAGRRPRAPHSAAATGPARALPHEVPDCAVRVLDLERFSRTGPGAARAARAVAVELAALTARPASAGASPSAGASASAGTLAAGAAEPVVAVRGRSRLVPVPVRPALSAPGSVLGRTPGGDPGPASGPSASPSHGPDPLPDGTWLVTGGLGGIGGAVADRLAAPGRTLVLVTRRPVADGAAWDTVRPEGAEPAPRTPPALAADLTRLAGKGAGVCVVQCDVADEPALTAALDEVRRRYGRIAGVVHAAGLPGGGVLALRAPGDIARVLEPKVRGTVLLHRLTEADRPLMVLCSSVLAVAGAAGQADYAAANAFLDGFAHTTDTAVSLGWDRWSETGMAVAAASPAPAAEAGEELDHPLFAARRAAPGGWTELVLRDGPDTAWLSREHRMAGEPVLPGTALLDLAVAAHRVLAHHDGGTAPHGEGGTAPRRPGDGGDAVELDAVFTEPVRMTEGDAPVVAVRLRPHADGGHDWEVRSSTTTRPHAQGRVRPHRGPRPARVDLAAAPEAPGGTEAEAPEDARPGLLETGPRWACVTRTDRPAHPAGDGGRHLLLTLGLPEEYRGDTGVHPLHPALLDAATGAVAQATGRHLPVAYGKLTVHRDIPADGRALVVLRSGDPAAVGDTLVADVTLTDREGDPVVTVEGFVLRPVPAGTAASGEGAAQHRPTAPAAPADGIPTAEGLRALERVLAHPHLAHVLVTPRAEAAPQFPAPQAGAATSGAQPLADAPAPAGQDGEAMTDVPSRIALVWARMLGLPAVAEDANLFELGADSLVIVQIAAQMRGAGLPVSPGDIFAHPTPAALARRIAEAEAEAEAEAGAGAGAAAAAAAGAGARDRAEAGAPPAPAPATGTPAAEAPPTPSRAPTPPAAAPPAPANPPADAPGRFPDADLSSQDLAQLMNLFRSGEDTQ